MDQELSENDPDRTLRIQENGTDSTKDIGLPFNDPMAIKANVISNLLESLDAQEGSSGPVRTMFAETTILEH
jgi:hypothetical protein